MTTSTQLQAQLLLAREVRLRRALEFALAHSDGSTTSGAIVAAFATLVDGPAGVAALHVLQETVSAIVDEGAAEQARARAWHALRDGYSPDEDAIAIVDIARAAARAAQRYRVSGDQVAIGPAAIEEFRASLVALFGEAVPETPTLLEWFARIDVPLWLGGLTITGIVTNILHEGRLLGSRGDLDKTRKRVSRVLSRLPNPREISAELPVPPDL